MGPAPREKVRKPNVRECQAQSATDWMDRATWQLGRESRGHTALMDAASHRQKDKVKDILRSSVDPNDQLYSGMTALMFASKWGWDKVVRELLRGKADLFRRTDKGETAFLLPSFIVKIES